MRACGWDCRGTSLRKWRGELACGPGWDGCGSAQNACSGLGVRSAHPPAPCADGRCVQPSRDVAAAVRAALLPKQAVVNFSSEPACPFVGWRKSKREAAGGCRGPVLGTAAELRYSLWRG